MRRLLSVLLLMVFLSAAFVSVALAVDCGKCGAVAPEGARFCAQCGTKLEPANCAKCSAALPKGAKFCPECGTAVPVAAAPPTPAPAASPTPQRPRVPQRYAGVFPVALYTSILGPVKPNPTAEETRAWRERFLGLVKSLGFNTVAGWVPPEMVTLAEQKGLYAIVDTGFAKQMGQQGLTEQAAADLCRRVSSGYQQNKNVIAAFLNTDPVEPGWFDNWRLLGKAWNDLCPDVPLLATYDNAALWRKFDEAAPLGAAQGWCYVFGEGRNTEQALTPPVCTHLECRDARAAMPGLPVWAWMPGILKGWGMREPSLAEMSAVHYLALTEGIRGAVLFPFLAPSKTGERYLADEKGEPIPLLLAMGPMLRDFAKMGAALLPYEIRNDLACTVEGKAAAGLYVDRDGKPKYLMVASRDVAATQKVKVTFPAQGQTIAKLTDFATSAGLASRAEGGRVVCEVELPPASGRLLAIGAAAAP